MKYINLVNKYYISIQSPESHSNWYWLWILQDCQYHTHMRYFVFVYKKQTSW